MTSGVGVRVAGQDVGAPGQAGGRGVAGAVEGGQRLAGQHQRDRVVPQRHDDPPRLGDLVGVAGRRSIRPGMARSEARCSTGWWVGPSSPTPMESCVYMWITGSSISADSRSAPRWKSEKIRNPAW